MKSRIPSINKVSDKRNLLSGAKYLFIRPRVPSVTIIYEGGNEKKMRLISTIHLRKFKSEILELWRVWKEGIPEKEKITQFEYPEYWRKHDIRAAWDTGLALACFCVLFSIFCLYSIFAPQEEINKTGNSGFLGVEIVFGILVFASAWGIFYACKCRRRVLCRVVVNAEKIEVEYENGKTKVFKKDDIKKYSFHPFLISCGVVIKFKDGTRLENLDRVSYWPVLQDRLLGH